MRDEEYRDPLIQNKDYKRKVVFNRIFKTFIFFLLVLLFIFSYYMYAENRRILLEEKILTQMKCISSCPVSLREDFEDSSKSILFFDESCHAFCSSVYKEDVEKFKKEYLAKNNTKVNVTEFNFCYKNLASTDYIKCFQNFFFDHRKIKDFQYYIMPKYPVYAYSISAHCNNTFMTIQTVYSSGEKNLTVFASIKKANGEKLTNVRLGFIEPRSTKEFKLSYPADVQQNSISEAQVTVLLDNGVALGYRSVKC